jgi:hypothetical protein
VLCCVVLCCVVLCCVVLCCVVLCCVVLCCVVVAGGVGWALVNFRSCMGGNLWGVYEGCNDASRALCWVQICAQTAWSWLDKEKNGGEKRQQEGGIQKANAPSRNKLSRLCGNITMWCHSSLHGKTLPRAARALGHESINQHPTLFQELVPCSLHTDTRWPRGYQVMAQ